MAHNRVVEDAEEMAVAALRRRIKMLNVYVAFIASVVLLGGLLVYPWSSRDVEANYHDLRLAISGAAIVILGALYAVRNVVFLKLTPRWSAALASRYRVDCACLDAELALRAPPRFKRI